MDLSAFLDTTHLGKLPAFVIAAGIGLLIGLERERVPNARAGLRTCALTALFGALAALIGDATQSQWVVAAGLLAVAAMIIAAYVDGDEVPGSGSTTVIAVLLAYGLGVLAYLEETHLAVSLGLATTALLYFKTEFAGMMQRFDRKDLLAVLQFGALSVVVLPLLPDEGFGPYGALNPYRIWLLVVLISGLSLAGFIALRLLGSRRSAIPLGIFGGMVSTTATTLSYARFGRDPASAPLAKQVILVANLVLPVRLAVVAAIVAPSFFFSHAAPVLGVSFVVGGIATWFVTRGIVQHGDLPGVRTKNPTELKAAFSFGFLFAVVLLLSAWLRDIAGDKGLYLVALAAGITDIDAIALSSMRMVANAEIGGTTAITAIVLALVSNQAAKLVYVLSAGGRALFNRCVVPMAAPAVAALLAVFAFA
ncbi:MAG: MgtC/SapB family protein [Burkholderiales bacterium]|nr:MgtC/SapB family protein [Burkholderiales bacterium]